MNIIKYLFITLLFVPKGSLLTFGSDGFNVGIVDIITCIFLIKILFKYNEIKHFLKNKESNIVAVFILICILSVFSSVNELETIKLIVKFLQLVVTVIYFRVSNISESIISICIYMGSFICILLLDTSDSDSKAYIAGIMLSALYLFISNLIKYSGKETKFYVHFGVVLLILINFMTYPKKGALLAFSIVLFYLWLFNIFKKKYLNLFVILIFTSIFFSLNMSLSSKTLEQFNEIFNFISGDISDVSKSLWVHLLETISIPFVIFDSEYLGYGASLTINGLSIYEYDRLVRISNSIFGEFVGEGLLNVGSNIYSDSLYLTLSHELGFFMLILMSLFLKFMISLHVNNKLIFSYMLYCVIYSLSAIDLLIYRGTSIFLLNGVFIGLLYNHSYMYCQNTKNIK